MAMFQTGRIKISGDLFFAAQLQGMFRIPCVAATIAAMATVEDRTGHATHEVLNQASPLENHNVFEADRVLVEALRARGRRLGRATPSHEVGAFAGSALAQRWGREANENPPKLRTHDRFGHRIDEVEFHPAWHELMKAGVGFGLHSLPWREPQPGAHVARAAMFMVLRPGRGRRRLPDLDDLLGDPGAARAARAGGRVGAALHLERLRRRAPAPGARQGRRAVRDGDDREAGRLGRPREHDHGAARSTAAGPAPSTS